MDETNPYAPPTEMDAPQWKPGEWRVGDGCLYFRDGARLPEIDLLSGRSDGFLAPAATRFRAPGSSAKVLRYASAVVFGGMLLLTVFLDVDLPLTTLAAGVFLLSFLSRALGRGSGKTALLRWQVDPTGFGPSKHLAWARPLYWGSLGMFLLILFAGFESWMLPAAAIFIMMSFGTLVIARSRVQLRCVGERDGWFEIRGIPAAGLAGLAGKARVSSEAGEPRMRRRKVFTSYLHRFPFLGLIWVRRWNPFAVLTLLILKIQRSPALVREQFHDSEAIDLVPSRRAPELQAAWKECDGLVISSWLADGRVVISGRLPVVRPRPAHVEAKRVGKDLAGVVRGHFRRVGDLPLDRVGSDEAWLERIRSLSDEIRQSLEEAGVYGPVREEEFPA
ncbi:hypothetical protein [Haloferula sargassicola]|uniref:DUF2868 domain-containing protein n=1 Tax=Haloferula sargassicola TaxID=490096 RepID=A0ABP9UXJ5_9BACT